MSCKERTIQCCSNCMFWFRTIITSNGVPECQWDISFIFIATCVPPRATHFWQQQLPAVWRMTIWLGWLFPQGQHVDDTWVVFIPRWLPSSLLLSSFQLLLLYFFQHFFFSPSKCCSLPLKINHKYPERRLLVAESCGALAPYLPVRTYCAYRIQL